MLYIFYNKKNLDVINLVIIYIFCKLNFYICNIEYYGCFYQEFMYVQEKQYTE